VGESCGLCRLGEGEEKNVASGRGLEAKGEWEEEDDERRLGRTKTVGGPLNWN